MVCLCEDRVTDAMVLGISAARFPSFYHFLQTLQAVLSSLLCLRC